MPPISFGEDPADHVRADHLEIPDGGKCPVQLSRMTHAETSPLLLDVTLSPDWRQKPLHQILQRFPLPGGEVILSGHLSGIEGCSADPLKNDGQCRMIWCLV